LLLKVDFKVHSDNHEWACDKITMQAFEKNSHLFVYFLMSGMIYLWMIYMSGMTYLWNVRIDL
jgi:hypothetical protein